MRPHALATCIVTGALVSSFFVRIAGAEQSGFAVNRSEPSERGSEWLTLDSLDLRSTRSRDMGAFVAAGVVGEYNSFGGSAIGGEFNFALSAGVRALDRKLLIGPQLFGRTVTRGVAPRG